MRLDVDAIRRRCEAHGVPLARVLRDAGISRTAYDSLVRRKSVLPKAVLKLAKVLDAPASALLDESGMEEKRMRRRIEAAKRIAGQSAGTKFENVWHTLALLDETPSERLKRALRRGRPRTRARSEGAILPVLEDAAKAIRARRRKR
jgi:transcriptional regulator with XRE-family HTH domain